MFDLTFWLIAGIVILDVLVIRFVWKRIPEEEEGYYRGRKK